MALPEPHSAIELCARSREGHAGNCRFVAAVEETTRTRLNSRRFAVLRQLSTLCEHFARQFGWAPKFFGLVFLAAFVLVPLIIEFTDRTGFGGAFNFAGFVQAIRTSRQETLAAGGLALVSYFISGIGTYLCYVGLIFTAPYALTVLAGVLHWYETRVKPGTLPAPIRP